MKKTNLIFILAATIGIFFSACGNKEIETNNVVNNEFYNEVRVLLSACGKKVLPIKMDTNLKFLGSQYNDKDRYISEFKICKVNDSLVSIKLTEDFKIDDNLFTNTSEETALLQECGKEKPMFSMSKKFTVCKRTDGFTQVKVYRNLN